MSDQKLKPSIDRIVAALRKRFWQTVREPTPSELDFIKYTGNHGEYVDRLQRLGQHLSAGRIKANAAFVGLSWLRLAKEHLEDAKVALGGSRQRAAFSRAYYCVYSASKSVRYIVHGAVTLAGDDHRKAADLPDDFPDVVAWAEKIPILYKHRLLSDYDNWRSTQGEITLTPADAVSRLSSSAQSNYFASQMRLWLWLMYSHIRILGEKI